ncbi:MAG: hypothetical protein WBA39_30980, partial [Rivularia sp. (in: cyanobacteria)]
MSEAAEVKTTDTTNKGSAFSKFKKILIGVVIAAIAGAGLYGAGWWQGRSQFAGDDEPIKRELQQTKELLNTATNRAYLMEARGDLYDVTVNLDERNFGMANTRLQEAAAALGKVEDGEGNLNINKIQELQKAVAKKNINVAVNLEQQRNSVLSYINVLNKLIPAEGNLEIPAA